MFEMRWLRACKPELPDASMCLIPFDTTSPTRVRNFSETARKRAQPEAPLSEPASHSADDREPVVSKRESVDVWENGR